MAERKTLENRARKSIKRALRAARAEAMRGTTSSSADERPSDVYELFHRPQVGSLETGQATLTPRPELRDGGMSTQGAIFFIQKNVKE